MIKLAREISIISSIVPKVGTARYSIILFNSKTIAKHNIGLDATMTRDTKAIDESAE